MYGSTDNLFEYMQSYMDYVYPGTRLCTAMMVRDGTLSQCTFRIVLPPRVEPAVFLLCTEETRKKSVSSAHGKNIGHQHAGYKENSILDSTIVTAPKFFSGHAEVKYVMNMTSV